MPDSRQRGLDDGIGLIDEKHKLLMSGTKMTVDLSTREGRNAARVYAWTLIAEGEERTGAMILGIVGREG